MKFCLLDAMFAFSYSFDCIEHDLIGVSTNHSKRVAYICAVMGKALKLNDTELVDLCSCAIMHDNALTEYIKTEYRHTGSLSLGSHCISGERNIEKLHFKSNVKGAVLYHHENADGSGPLHKTADEVPLYAKLIHIADLTDAQFNIKSMNSDKFERITAFVKNNINRLFDEQTANVFLSSFTYENMAEMGGDNINYLLKNMLPHIMDDFSNEQIISFANVFASIIDYKSEFTKRHSIGIAEKAYTLGKYYKADDETCAKLYLAGALHDIGKLVVERDILEKPDKLTKDEYTHIQTHAYATYEILSKIDGFEDITSWASMHHEKLDGSGYPFGKTASQLGFYERVMGCLDIYQALTEERPYKDGMKHGEAMKIINMLVDKGQLDKNVAKDIDTVFGKA